MWETFIEVIRPYLNAVLIGFGGFAIAFVISQIIGRLLAKPMGSGWSRFLGSLVGLAVVLWTFKLILESAGAAGFVVVVVTALTGAFALGSERIASDLVAGVSLFFTQIYKPGQYVHIAGYAGKVVSTSLLVTTLESVHGDHIYIRNADVMNGTIINYSVQPGHLVSVKLALPLSEDVSTAVSVIEEAVQGFSPELEQARESYRPKVVVEEPAFVHYLSIEVRAYVSERLDYGPEKTRLYLLAFNAVKNAGLKLSVQI